MSNSNAEKKNFFETWFETQKNVMENWYNTTEEMKQKTAESAKETQETSADYLKNWYESQMAFFRNNDSKETSNENPFAPVNPIGFFNNWMKQQTKMAEEWRGMMGTANPMMSSFTPGMEGMNDMQKNWKEMMQKWNDEISNRFGIKAGMNPVMGMNDFTNGFAKFMELWMPVFNAMQSKTFTPEMWKQYFEPARHKDLMDKMFNFDMDGMKPMLQNYFNMLNNHLRQSTGAGSDKFREMASQMEQFFPHNENSPFVQYMGLYNQMMNNFTGAESPFIKMMTPGAKREQIIAFNEMGNDISQYIMKRSEMQYMMYMTGLKAVEAFSEAIYNKMEKGVEIDSFMKFYNEWLGMNDKVFLELFSSDEYSRIQNELTEVSLKLKTGTDKMMEGMFSNFPLVPRSEMDHLYKTIYDLKKKVRNMEKEFATAQKSQPAAEKTATGNTKAEASKASSASESKASSASESKSANSASAAKKDTKSAK
ncbi:MAG: poly(R)-hydroxyalkanoic acid synthase subunit PhaE [Bacteroidia bacterium]